MNTNTKPKTKKTMEKPRKDENKVKSNSSTLAEDSNHDPINPLQVGLDGISWTLIELSPIHRKRTCVEQSMEEEKHHVGRQSHLFRPWLQCGSVAKAQSIRKREEGFEKSRHSLPDTVHQNAYSLDQRSENIQYSRRGYRGPTKEGNWSGKSSISEWSSPARTAPVIQNCSLAARWTGWNRGNKTTDQTEAARILTRLQREASWGKRLGKDIFLGW